MFDLRVGGIAAGAAFILSLLAGAAGGVRLPLMLLRAALFAGGGFLFAALVLGVCARFLPELVQSPENEAGGGEDGTDREGPPAQGTLINIMEEGEGAGDGEGGGDTATPAPPAPSEEGGGASGGLEQTTGKGYTETTVAEFSPLPPPPALPAGGTGGADGDGERKKVFRNGKAPAGNFDPEDLAMAIRAKLKQNEG